MKAATIRDVAQHAQVSVASVSRVLNGAGAVTDETRQRVLQAIDALHYVPHSGARSLSTSRTQTVGVVLPDLYGEFFSELIRGMDIAARKAGYHLIVSSSHGDADEVSSAIRSMRGRVDGLVVLSPHIDATKLAAGMAGRLPVLLMNSAAVDTGRPSIVVDNRGGAITAVRHLIEIGRRRIAHISGPSGNLEAEARLAGYLEAMAGAGLTPMVVQGDFMEASGHAAGADLAARAQRPDGLFAGNDMMAVGALLALQDAGVRCPEDIAVVGFDDIPLAAFIRPSLTTLRTHVTETGARALDRVIALIGRDDPTADIACEVVQPELVVRQSSLPQATPSQSTPARSPVSATAL